MRVLFSAIPCASHIDPLVPLAQALQGAGHEVRFSTGTHGQIAGRSSVGEMITTAGLTAVLLDSQEPPSQQVSIVPSRLPEAMVQPIGQESWRAVRDELIAVFSWHAPPDPEDPGRCTVLDNLVAFARAWQPDLLLWDFLGPAASIAAEVIGIPHVRLVYGQDKVALADQWQPADDDRFHQWMQPFLRRYGLTYSKRMLLGQRSIDGEPVGTQQAHSVSYLPIRRVPYTGARPLPAWLHQPPQRRRVCVTLGWAVKQLFDQFGLSIAELSAMASALDAEMVVTAASDQLADGDGLPHNVRVVDYVPLDVLLPTCSAVVHHGGTSTLAAVVAHQLPQVIIPAAHWNEAADARYVENHGAGLTLNPHELSAKELHDRLQRVLDEPSFRAGATALRAQSLAAPSPLDMVNVLEGIAADSSLQSQS